MKKASRQALRRLRGTKVDRSAEVPGPTHDPAANLVMADVVMRMGAYVMRRAVQRSLLADRYGKGTARNIIRKRSLMQTLTSVTLARIATSSLPGAALVTTGMAAKILIDRSKARHEAEAEGDIELIEQASGE